MNYRETRGAYLNCEKRMYEGIGPYDIPTVEPINMDLTYPKLIGFNYAIGERHPAEKIVHFFLDDYQFDRVWNDPNKYLPILQRFRAVIAPDFSLYADFPKAVQIFNHYRKQWLSAFWQENGIDVIPCIGWSDEDSFGWCFDGVPTNSTVCVSTVGGFHSKASKEAWLKGYKKALEVLNPSNILLFGKMFPEIEAIDYKGFIMVVDNSNLTRKNTLSKKSNEDKSVDKSGVDVI